MNELKNLQINIIIVIIRVDRDGLKTPQSFYTEA